MARGAVMVMLGLLFICGRGQAAVQDGDRKVERAIAQMIADDPMMRQSPHISIEADNGVVFLYGNVISLFDKMQAGLYAQKAEGVKEVHNCLKVRFRWPWEDEACGNLCEDAFEQWKWY